MMKRIQNSSQSIGGSYPTATGRRKRVIVAAPSSVIKKVAMLGDSTLDNGCWVQERLEYIDKTHTVTHQTAVALAKNTSHNAYSYDIGNFAVDGATTSDLNRNCLLCKVIPEDPDHPCVPVNQLETVSQWQPDIVVLSVGGNNYREALRGVLQRNLNSFQLLFRITPKEAKPIIKDAFKRVKSELLKEYKAIIDHLIKNNPMLNRIIVLSQYFPSITDFTSYFIYTGFSHLARSEGKGQTPFTAVENTMNDLYRDVLQYVATKKKEVVFVDVTSSFNPLGGNHIEQIEPNEQGSKIMGRLIAAAVEYHFPTDEAVVDKLSISILRMNPDETIRVEMLKQRSIQCFKVKKIESFICENRYRHVGLFFSPNSTLRDRYVYGYELVMGKQFDVEYTGLFAFGLLDPSIITILASYLWRVAINEKTHRSLRVTAGVIAAPILLIKMIIGSVIMLALGLPIYGYHKAVSCVNGATSNKETSLRDEAKDREEVCILSPIRAD